MVLQFAYMNKLGNRSIACYFVCAFYVQISLFFVSACIFFINRYRTL